MAKLKPSGSGLRLTWTGILLVSLSLILPACLFTIAAFQSYYQTYRQLDARVERTTRVLQEHAIKVFETHRLVIGQINAELKKIDWNNEQSVQELHETLKLLQLELDQVATITIVDADGYALAGSRSYPIDRKLSFADRDWFQNLKSANNDTLYVSGAYPGRQSNERIFNIAARISTQGAFKGGIAVSVDRAYFENFYKDAEPEYDFSVTLLRNDGVILARFPDTPIQRIPDNAAILAQIHDNLTDAFTSRSWLDGRVHIEAYRPVGNYPVLVVFGIDRRSAFSMWRQNLALYGAAASIASIALLLVSLIAIRQNRKWQRSNLALRAEAASRQAAEEKLRQSQKIEAIGQLTGGIAHDFNNLLTGIAGSLDLLASRIAQGRFSELDKYMSAAKKSAERAAALTHRLLAFSRQQALDPKPTDINRLAADMEDLIRRTVGPSISVEFVGSSGLWTVFADANQLENALLNLCINARDAMPDGGKLTIESGNRWLDDHAAREGDLPEGQYVSLCVSDTGTGMEQDVIDRAFDPFFTTKPLGKGTGLGLSMTYGFARQSGGTVRIYSEASKGTMVCIYLPRYRGDAATDKPVQTPAKAQNTDQNETIVLIDDEPTIRMLISESLNELGYTVIEAGDGAEGLKILQSGIRVDLLVTDVGLPNGMNGRQVAEAARHFRSGLKVLFITGYAENAVIGHGLLEPDMHMLTKPFPMELLASRIKSILASG